MYRLTLAVFIVFTTLLSSCSLVKSFIEGDKAGSAPQIVSRKVEDDKKIVQPQQVEQAITQEQTKILEKRVDDLNREIGKLDNELKAAKRDLTLVRKENSEYMSQLVENQTQLAQMQAEVQKLKLEKITQENDYALKVNSLEQELTKKSVEVEKLKVDISKLILKNNELEKNVIKPETLAPYSIEFAKGKCIGGEKTSGIVFVNGDIAELFQCYVDNIRTICPNYIMKAGSEFYYIRSGVPAEIKFGGLMDIIALSSMSQDERMKWFARKLTEQPVKKAENASVSAIKDFATKRDLDIIIGRKQQ